MAEITIFLGKIFRQFLRVFQLEQPIQSSKKCLYASANNKKTWKAFKIIENNPKDSEWINGIVKYKINI